MPRTLTFGFALLHMRTPLRSWIIESERWKTLWFVGEFVAFRSTGCVNVMFANEALTLAGS